MFKRWLCLITVVLVALPALVPLVAVQAAVLPISYPRLANYFLKWEISDDEVPQLAKWSVLVLDMENQETSRDKILKIRQLNPQIIILAYVTSQEILDKLDYYNQAYLRQDLNSGLIDSWWLKDIDGHKISNWPNTFMLNLSDGAGTNSQGERFNDYLPEFVANRLKPSGLWDGVFYDNTWGQVSWVSSRPLDINNNQIAEDNSQVDQSWAIGFKKMLAKTKSLTGPDFLIVGNGKIYEGYQRLLNGMMLENFPSSWEGDGTWAGSMKSYLKLFDTNVTPQLSLVNVYNKNQNNFRLFRYGLASTLLGDGFYSYDYDTTNHGQTWWYDEYNVSLGSAQSAPYNLLSSSFNLQAGLWRRDFKNGIALVNSTDQVKTYVFNREEFQKIKGTQDPGMNNGQKINYIKLAAHDGIILRKANTLITNSAFTNGYFFRVFDGQGRLTGNSFFSYVSAFPGEAEVLIGASDEATGDNVSLGAFSGQLKLVKNGRQQFNIKPFGTSYKKSLSLSASLVAGSINKIVVGSGAGGGPQVQVYSTSGKLTNSFFAYDKKLRNGVNLVLGDVYGDGVDRIVTGPGQGSEPVVKVFSLTGQLERSFLAYDNKMLGGVNVALGDVNGDGQLEIITAPASQGGPQVRIFSSNGQSLGSFFAYDQKYHGGLKVTASDMTGSGRAEILVGLPNFY
jgi:hypothetical protein